MRSHPTTRNWCVAAFAATLLLGCATIGRYSDTAFENRDWRLVELGGRAAARSTGMRQAFVRFANDSMRVTGSGGCNRIFGPYTRTGQRIALGPLASTRMACADSRLNAQETDFLAALQATNRYEIEHDTLTLARDGEPLARLASLPQ